MPQKVTFGEDLVSPEEKTRRVGSVFTSHTHTVSRFARP